MQNTERININNPIMGRFIGNTYHMCINYNYLTTVVYESVSETFNDYCKNY